MLRLICVKLDRIYICRSKQSHIVPEVLFSTELSLVREYWQHKATVYSIPYLHNISSCIFRWSTFPSDSILDKYIIIIVTYKYILKIYVHTMCKYIRCKLNNNYYRKVQWTFVNLIVVELLLRKILNNNYCGVKDVKV